MKTLLNQLNKNRISLSLEDGQLVADIPEPPPAAAAYLLDQVKKHKPQLIKYLTWNEDAACHLFKLALDRVRFTYRNDSSLKGVVPWAIQHQPAPWQAVEAAESRFNDASKRQDMARAVEAAGAYEQAFMDLFSLYRQHIANMDASKAMKAFCCTKAWNLPPEKVAQLEGIFQHGGPGWR